MDAHPKVIAGKGNIERPVVGLRRFPEKTRDRKNLALILMT